MNLLANPPILPMLANRVGALPDGDGWIFEPKWDGFRALVFRDGDEILIQSRDEKPLNRYFPELIDSLRAQLPDRVVLDGEIVIARDGVGLDFEALQMRLHPAASRVALLAKQIPSAIVFFDLLCLGDRDLRAAPFHERRAALTSLLAGASPPIHLTPATDDRTVAADWFSRFEGAGFDGVMAKASHSAYEPNKRVMLKVKHERECDCVVGGFRWHKGSERTAVGSLLLGLFDDDGALQHVGVAASFTAAKRRELVDLLAPYRAQALENHPWSAWASAMADGGGSGGGVAGGHGDVSSADGGQRRRPGGQSRWSQGKDLSWEPLRPELVVEVAYDHMQGARFRHTAHFRRWRPDKPTSDCTYAQLEVVPPQELNAIFSTGRR